MAGPNKSEKQRAVMENRRKAKVIIKELREHQQQVDEDKEEAVDCRSQKLTEHFQKAEDNYGKSDTVDQALVDAQIFHKLGIYSKRQAEQLQSGLRIYDRKTYVDNLVQNMERAQVSNQEDDDTANSLAINLTDIGRSMAKRWRHTPAACFMYGSAPRPPVASERKKAKRVMKGSTAEKPTELKSEEVEQTETDRQVAAMQRELEKRKKCNYWIFVLDPDSFTRSIENVFHSSFLIKDNLAALDLKTDPPIIQHCRPRDRQEGASGSAVMKNSQFIMGFDRNTWLEMIEKHNIRRCILPSRDDNGRKDSQMQRLLALEQMTKF